jgi:hypothetical protein
MKSVRVCTLSRCISSLNSPSICITYKIFARQLLNSNRSLGCGSLFNTIVDENKGMQEVCRIPIETLKKALEATYFAPPSKAVKLK